MRLKQRVESLGATILLAFTSTFSTATAQESVNAAGGNASSSRGSVCYSVGQFVYITHTGTNGSVAEGIQQPYEISLVKGSDEDKNINLSLSAYPNPTTDYLQLIVNASDKLSIQSLSYQLYNIKGKLMQSGKLTGTETQINMSSYGSSIYFVRVIQNNKEVKLFKIIKN